jgi:hypothetical protein
MKAEAAVLVGGAPAPAVEGGIDGLLLLVLGVIIATFGVRLPDLDQCIG